jgi:hypothetical protein
MIDRDECPYASPLRQIDCCHVGADLTVIDDQDGFTTAKTRCAGSTINRSGPKQ